MSVALAGSTMHFIMAFVLLYSLLVFAGVQNPDSDRWTVAAVTEESPAAEAGLRAGDRIVALDGNEVTRFEDLRDLIGDRIGETSTVVVERGGDTFERRFTIEQHPDDPGRGFLGVAPEYPKEREGLLSGIPESASQFGHIFTESGKALVSFFSPSALGDYAEKVTTAASQEDVDDGRSTRERIEDEGNRFLSPVGAVRLGADMADAGFAGLLGFLVMINIFVGIFNLVPLLPLDGGHVAIATYEKIRSMISGKRYYVDVAKLLPLTYAVVLLLVTIGITALYLDLIDPISLR